MGKLMVGTENGMFSLDKGSSAIRKEGGPPSIAFMTHALNGVYAVTSDGALWAKDGARDWRLVNRRPIGDEVWAIGCDPRLPGRLYLGVSPALLYISNDGGESWKACDSIRRIPGYETWTFPPPPHVPHVRSIAPDPKAIGAVYIGVEEGGIYRSADDGETWESLNDGLYWDVHTVTPAADGSHLYATTGAGFHRSDDGGQHWQHITTGLDRRYTVPFVASERRPERLFTAVAMLPPPNWANGGANAALYRSDDAGEHWTQLAGGLPERFDVMVREVALDGVDDVYAACGNVLYASHDAGENWEQISTELPRVRALAVV